MSIRAKQSLRGRLNIATIIEPTAYILVDEDGTEIPAVFVDNEVNFTATANDIRIGTTAVGAEGVTEGTKMIPSYHTSQGQRLVPAGSSFTLPMQYYDYTKLQAVFCLFNTSLPKSVAAVKVAIDDAVYSVQSTVTESAITINHDVGYVDFGLVNDLDTPCVIRYFSYKEID